MRTVYIFIASFQHNSHIFRASFIIFCYCRFSFNYSSLAVWLYQMGYFFSRGYVFFHDWSLSTAVKIFIFSVCVCVAWKKQKMFFRYWLLGIKCYNIHRIKGQCWYCSLGWLKSPGPPNGGEFPRHFLCKREEIWLIWYNITK